MKKDIVAIIVALLVAFSFNIAYADNFASAGAAFADDDTRFSSIEFFDSNNLSDIDPNSSVAYEYREVLGVRWYFTSVTIVTPDDQYIGVTGDARTSVSYFATTAFVQKRPIRIGRVDGRIVSIGLADWD